MPSRIYRNDGEIEDSKKVNQEGKATLDSDNTAPTSNPKTSKGVAPFIISDDAIDTDVQNDIFVHDGEIFNKSVRVVRSASKVSTEFHKDEIPISEFNKKTDTIGKKKHDDSGSGINRLRSRVGGSWKRTGQRLVFGISVILLISLIFFSIGTSYILRLWNNVPNLDSKPFESSVVYARDGKTVLFRFYQEERREILQLCTTEQEKNLEAAENCIPQSMQLAMIALEDERFYYNDDGIPWSNIAGSVIKCVQSAGDECRGGSGLSQQLVKNVTKQDDFSIERKITELLTAIKLNQEITKSDILFLYLNEVPFGRNAYGVQEAARSYFGKNIKDITLPESCYIASLVQQPTIFNNSINKPDSTDWIEFQSRKNTCLGKMKELDLRGDGVPRLITSDAELQELRLQQVQFQANKSEFAFPHFKDYITEELRKFKLSEQALSTQGYKIITTLDPDIQTKTEQSIKELEQSAVLNNGANNVAAVVLDGPTGEIMAMVGSRDYNNLEIDGQVNIVTSPQQPGSSIKPYVYAAAMSKNFNPATVLMDVPTTFEGGFRPKNYSGTFSGALSMRYALQGSLNIPAVKAAYLAAGDGLEPDGGTGINSVFNFSEQMGVRYPCIDGAFNNNPLFTDNVETCKVQGPVTSDIIRSAYRDRCYVSSSIGGCEVTMLSHATGMNTFAQDGNLRTATPFLSIISTQNGRDIYKEVQESEFPVYPKRDAVIDPLIARQMSNVLSDYQARYPIFGTTLARNLELEGWNGDNRVAAKTGTTDQVRDTWTVGYTPYYTTAVWVGNTDNKPMNDNASSSSAPAPIWKKIMTSLHENKEKKGFSKEGLIPVRVNPRSGYLVDEGGIVELMTPTQIEVLKQAATLLSKPDYDPKANSIFQNRSSIVTRKLKINIADQKLAVENKTLPQNITDLICTEVVSEFPRVAAWLQPVQGWNDKSGGGSSGGCPVLPSEQDQVNEQNNKPSIEVNNVGNSFENIITIVAVPNGAATKSISKISIFIDGQEVIGVINEGRVSYTIPENLYGPNRTVRFLVLDSWGITNEVVYTGVSLGKPAISVSELSTISPQCNPATAGSTTSCVFNLPSDKSLPGTVRISIGSVTPGGSCGVSARTVSCGNVPVTTTTGEQIIYIALDSGAAIATQGKLTVS